MGKGKRLRAYDAKRLTKRRKSPNTRRKSRKKRRKSREYRLTPPRVD
jgi:hypothetical protein